MEELDVPSKTEDRRIRVLLIGPLPIATDVVGGTKTSFAKLVDDFTESARFDTEVICTSRGLVGKGKSMRVLLNLATLILTICRAFWRARASDVIFFNVSSGGVFGAGLLIWLVAKLRKRPLIVRVFGGSLGRAYDDRPRWLRFLADRTFLRSERLLLQTKPLCKRFRDRPGVRWLPTTRDMHSNRATSFSCRRFLYLSHLRRDKGYVEALRASDHLLEGCTLTVAGSVTQDTDLTAFCKFPRARYVGRVEPADVFQLLEEHDALVFPSYYEGEGIPGVVIEAMQCGLPVIAAHWKFAPEVVQEGVGGLLVEPKSTDALSEAMNRLANDDKLFRRLTEGARQRGNEFRSSVWQTQIERWCREVCGRSSSVDRSVRRKAA